MYAVAARAVASTGNNCPKGDPTSIKVVPKVISLSANNCSFGWNFLIPVPDVVSPDSTYLTYKVTYPRVDSVDGIE